MFDGSARVGCGERFLRGQFDGIDQGRGAVVNGGHAHAERLRIVQPAGDVVDGAQRQVQTEPGADGVGDGSATTSQTSRGIPAHASCVTAWASSWANVAAISARARYSGCPRTQIAAASWR